MVEQLWLVRGSDPVIFSVPFYANFEHEHSTSCTIFHAVPLLNRHLEAVKALLSPISTFERGMWRIERIALERIGKRVDISEGIDPAILFTWERPRAQRPPVIAQESRKDIDEFLDGVYASGLPVTREALAVIYNQLCLHALDWLVNKERPLDLYFVRLHNCPYRSNWKSVLLSRFPRMGKLLTRAHEILREAIAGEVGLDDELRCPDLLAMHKKWPVIHRSIEAEPTAIWYKETWKVERVRHKMLGPIEYARYVMGSVDRWSKSALRIYASWLNTIARKCAADVEGGPDGEYRLVPNQPRTELLAVPRASHPVPVVVPNRAAEIKGASQPGNLYPKNGILPDEMPPVQSPSADLWNGWRYLRAPKLPFAKPGVLLLAARKGGNSMQLLGSERGSGHRVANGVEQLSKPDPNLDAVMP